MQRTLEPEILDTLPPDHPDALHNRRDLRLINRLMGNHRWVAAKLSSLLRPGETALELGAGTGELGLQLAARGVALDGLDLWPRPATWPAARSWHVSDLRTFSGYPAYAGVVGNLIFHQFSNEELAAVGAAIRRHARIILACEPARSRAAQRAYRVFAPLLGANYVSRHDGYVSIAAGFVADELPRALGLDPSEWDCRCAISFRSAYHMIAIRRA